MRYPASEKLEIIRLVEQSHLPVRRTLEKLGIQRTQAPSVNGGCGPPRTQGSAYMPVPLAPASAWAILARLAVLGATLAILASAVGSVSAASPSKSLGHQSTAKVTRIGTGHIGRRSGGQEGTDLDQTQPDPEEAQAELDKQIPNSISAARVPSSHVPRPGAMPIVDATGAGFDGLNHFDQRTAGTGDYVDTQFSIEPPDQALCVGNGFVVEAVNNAARVRSANGDDLSGVVALNQFWGLAPKSSARTARSAPFIVRPQVLLRPGHRPVLRRRNSRSTSIL